MQYRLLPTKKAPEIPVLARFASPKPSLPMMFGPNIIGHSELDTTVDGNSLIFLASGAFSREVVQASGGYAAYQSVLTVQRHGNFDFDASNSNAIFGKSSVVQPSSIRLLPCIKI